MVRHLRSIRGRITLISTILVAATLVLASIVLMRWVESDLLATAQSSVDQALEDQAESLGLTPEAVADLGGSLMVEAEVDGSDVFVGLFTEAGDGLAYGELFVDDEPVAGLVLEVDTGDVVELVDLQFGEPLDDDDLIEEIESLFFEVLEISEGEQFLVGAAPLDEVEESIAAIRQALIVIVPLLVAAFAVLIWWMTGRALRPVRSITDQVQAISSSSLDRRVPVPVTGDEIAELATVMNRMLDRLERGGDRQRQFSADASHELRSPLSTVRAAAELLAGHPPRERAGRLADDIVVEADRMEELIADLLELSRLDEDRRVSAMEPVNIAELIRFELAADVERDRTGIDPGPVVEVVAPAELVVDGQPRQLARMIRNLVDNAKRHATARVEVQLQIEVHPKVRDSIAGAGVRITVDDDGTGVAVDQRDRIFERFSRLDEARTRDTGGAGLGLALVRAIVDNHDGDVSVEDSPLGGARFVVELPGAG